MTGELTIYTSKISAGGTIYPQCANHAAAFSAVTELMASLRTMCALSASPVVSARTKFRLALIHALIDEKACSIGLKSGEYGGRYSNRIPLDMHEIQS